VRDPGSQVGQYISGLDGLRGVAVLGVMTAHCFVHFAPTTTPNGTGQILAQGVTVFFALSGMLIYTPFVRDIADGKRRVRLGQFARRRLLRIFPVYLVIFVICDVGLHAVYRVNAVESASTASDAGTGLMTDPAALLLNLSLLHSFVPEYVQTGINPSWSLSTELSFYALLPVLAVWLVGRSSRRWALALVPPVVLGIIGLAGRAWAEHLFAQSSGLTVSEAEFGSNGIAVLTQSLAAIGDSFALGMVVAVLFVWTQRSELSWWSRRRASVAGWTLVALGAIGGLLLKDSHHWFVGTATSLTGAGMVLLVVDPGARGETSLPARAASWRPLVYLGEISLSVYLWHFPVIIVASRTGLFEADTLGTLAGSFALVAFVTIALSAVTFALIERPAMTGRWPTVRRRAIR
jgi:peptidoglycan/LPS O-acetylase OafA/YrhL